MTQYNNLSTKFVNLLGDENVFFQQKNLASQLYKFHKEKGQNSPSRDLLHL